LPDRFYETPNIIELENLDINRLANDSDFINYAVENFIPDKSSYRSFSSRSSLLHLLKTRVKKENGSHKRFNRSDIANIIYSIAKRHNEFEAFRFSFVNNIVQEKDKLEII
jgi:hypothetical protein